jgi:hypothetical protein
MLHFRVRIVQLRVFTAREELIEVSNRDKWCQAIRISNVDYGCQTPTCTSLREIHLHINTPRVVLCVEESLRLELPRRSAIK